MFWVLTRHTRHCCPLTASRPPCFAGLGGFYELTALKHVDMMLTGHTAAPIATWLPNVQFFKLW